MSAIDNMMKVDPKELKRLMDGALTIKNLPYSNLQKFYILKEVVDSVAALIAPATPCKDKCSYCCYMAVCVTDLEAELIGERVGRTPIPQPKLRSPKAIKRKHDLMLRKYTLKPCPFLKDESCNIYDVRPIACRQHHNLDDTNHCCDIRHKQNTPQLDLWPIDQAYVDISMDMAWADMRDYFP